MKYDAVKELNKRKGCLEIKKIIENHLGSETRATAFTFYRYIATFQAIFLLKGEFMSPCKVTVFP